MRLQSVELAALEAMSGVFGVVGAWVSGAFGRYEDDRRALPAEPGRERDQALRVGSITTLTAAGSVPAGSIVQSPSTGLADFEVPSSSAELVPAPSWRSRVRVRKRAPRPEELARSSARLAWWAARPAMSMPSRRCMSILHPSRRSRPAASRITRGESAPDTR